MVHVGVSAQGRRKQPFGVDSRMRRLLHAIIARGAAGPRVRCKTFHYSSRSLSQIQKPAHAPAPVASPQPRHLFLAKAKSKSVGARPMATNNTIQASNATISPALTRRVGRRPSFPSSQVLAGTYLSVLRRLDAPKSRPGSPAHEAANDTPRLNSSLNRSTPTLLAAGCYPSRNQDNQCGPLHPNAVYNQGLGLLSNGLRKVQAALRAAESG